MLFKPFGGYFCIKDRDRVLLYPIAPGQCLFISRSATLVSHRSFCGGAVYEVEGKKFIKSEEKASWSFQTGVQVEDKGKWANVASFFLFSPRRPNPHR